MQNANNSKTCFSLPGKYAHHQITIKAFADRIKLYHEDKLIVEN